MRFYAEELQAAASSKFSLPAYIPLQREPAHHIRNAENAYVP